MRCATDWCPFPDETDTNDCEWCDGCDFYKAPPTNADRIRAMSDEKLADYLCLLAGCFNCEARMLCENLNQKSADWYKQWLKQPLE